MILASAHPLTLVLALVASVSYAICATGATRTSVSLTRAAIWLAWCVHAALVGWGLWGADPRFGFAPALSLSAWLVGLVYALEGYYYPKLNPPWMLAGVGSAAVLLALLFPGTPLLANTSALLPLHWALGMASYVLFAVAVAHAWLMNRAEKRIRIAADAHTGLPLLTMEHLTFQFVGLGFGLLTATLMAGFFFDSQLYGTGHPVKFDHKTAFSVLSWLTFAVLIIGRARFGWRGKKAIRVLYVGSGLLLLAYVGSRFVLEVILGRAL
jgi:ABC-type uncharacterized transport system permease subunit